MMARLIEGKIGFPPVCLCAFAKAMLAHADTHAHTVKK